MIEVNNIFNCSIPERDETFNDLLKHKTIKIERIVSSDKTTPFFATTFTK